MKKYDTINGPINVFRLEGYFNGKKKILHIFSDVHHIPSEQTHCINKSPNISDYLRDKLTTLQGNKSNNYDIFFEIFSSDYDKIDGKYVGTYIEEFGSHFRSMIIEKKFNNKFRNIRFHYTDHRDYLFAKIDRMVKESIGISEKCMDTCNQRNNMIDDIIDRINIIENIFDFHKNIIIFVKNHPKSSNKSKNENTEDEILGYNTIRFFDKLINRIQNKKVYLFVNDKLIPYFMESIDIFKNRTTKIKKIINMIKNKTIEKKDLILIRKMMLSVRKKILLTYSIIGLDVYFIKRFLDKDYIENGILYCGANHSIRIIYYLSRYFGFSITNASSLPLVNVDQVNELIKSMNRLKIPDIKKLLFAKNIVETIQCSNISWIRDDFM
jgi:accessory colonization factor AcfC